MKCWMLWAVTALVLVAVSAHGQPRPPGGRDRLPIRVQSGGNELIALRNAPVAYTTLEQLVTDVGRAGATRATPIRVVRASPRQTIDYVFCVTNVGTLVVGERIHTFDESRQRYLFTRAEIARSYPPLEERGGWLWLLAVELSRETTVTFEVRAIARWPVEAVTITPSPAP
jgi:hypothetical protein